MSPMELESILDFIQNKNILITGATGFLAKILLEKILRVQPNVQKLYLLLRASDPKHATQRLHNEIIGKDLFRVLRQKWGASTNSIVSEKLKLIPGDISKEGLGLEDPELREEILNEVDVIVNLAATTNFDERYDVALGINTMGAKHVVIFAKLCVKLKVLVHVSTAYVWGEKEGLLQERPCQLGESLNGTSGLDIDYEITLAAEKVEQLRSDQVPEPAITQAIKDFGLKRASVYGWPNTYVFTKAMGEMLVGDLRGNLPVVILRPTIITSTYKEPFPGWVEGIRTIDSVAVGYAKGKLTFFLCDIEAIVDVVPADMVVNSIIAAMAAHANGAGEVIYQLGSSLRNPVRYDDLHDYGFRYFTNKPWINKDGKPITVRKVAVMNSMDSFHRYMTLRYLLVLKGLEVVNMAFCQYFEGTYTDMNRKIKFVMRLVDLYRPYLFFKGVFDDMNTEKLRMRVREGTKEEEIFYFDPKIIDWDDYFMNIHISGVVKYVFK